MVFNKDWQTEVIQLLGDYGAFGSY